MPPAFSVTVPVQGADLKYFLLSYDEQPQERIHPSGKISEHVLATLKSEPITDVFLFSHGWQGDVGAANEQYQGWLKAMWNLTSDRDAMRQRSPKFMPLLIGLHWPSLPWGNESLDAPLSFSNGVDPTADLVNAYAKRLGDSVDVRGALQKVVAVSQVEDPQDQLSAELQAAYGDLAKAVALPTGGPQGAPGADSEGFDPEAIYEAFRKNDAEVDVVDFGTSWRDSLLAPLRALSFWKMKDRARIFGEQAVNPFLKKIQETAPKVRTHLAGHSFGCIVASAGVAGGPGSAALVRPVDSLVLLQGALSLWSYTSKIPFMGQGAGYFNRVLKDKLVARPIVSTQSEHDTAVGTWYPRAARVAGQVAFLPGQFPKYGAVGTFGLQGDGCSPQPLTMFEATKPYSLKAGQIYNVESSQVINIGGGFSGAHSDIRKPAVAHLVWNAILGS